MMTNKSDKLKFKALQSAILDNKIKVKINFNLLNQKGTPFFNPWENVLPIIIITVFSIVIMFSSGIISGTLVLLIGVIGYLKLFPFIMEDIMHQRVVMALTKSLDSFQQSWNSKGIALIDEDNSRAICKSPDGDWQEFVVINFASLMVDKPKDD